MYEGWLWVLSHPLFVTISFSQQTHIIPSGDIRHPTRRYGFFDRKRIFAAQNLIFVSNRKFHFKNSCEVYFYAYFCGVIRKWIHP